MSVYIKKPETQDIEHIIKSMTDIIHSKSLSDCSIINWACPVPFFGSPTESVIATLGLNPSNKEFVDNSNNEIHGAGRRFPTLKSLKLESWDLTQEAHTKSILNACRNYFLGNPYDNWFKSLDSLISGTNFSYYSTLFPACHLDLIPFATEKKWANLTTAQKNKLLELSGDFLGDILKATPIQIIILNGITVVDNFRKISNLELCKELMPTWSLPRNKGNSVPGYSYQGTTDTVHGIALDKKIHILGFNHNIQSSFGVTSSVKSEIRKWIEIKSTEILK